MHADAPNDAANAIGRFLDWFRLAIGRRSKASQVARVGSSLEMMRELDARSRKYLGMSGDEFLAALEADRLALTPTVVQLSILAGRPTGSA